MLTAHSNNVRKDSRAVIRAVIVGLLFATAAAIGNLLKPTTFLADKLTTVDLETMVPAEFAGWKLVEKQTVTAIDPTVQTNLDATYDALLARTYANVNGDRVMLTVAYGKAQTHDLKAHRQEVCYRSQGFDIRFIRSDDAQITKDPTPVTRVLAERVGRSEPITYWFIMGDLAVRSINERLLAGLYYSFKNEIPDGFMVRVSNISSDAPHAFGLHDEFSRQLIKAMAPDVRRRFAGR
jgi:EpsI family protein